ADKGLGGSDHEWGQFRQVLAVKGGLHQPPLPQPEIARAGQHAVAGEQADRAVEKVGFAVVLVVLLEDVLDGLGMREEIDIDTGEGPEANIMPVVTVRPRVQLQRVALELPHAAQQPVPARAGCGKGWPDPSRVWCNLGCTHEAVLHYLLFQGLPSSGGYSLGVCWDRLPERLVWPTLSCRLLQLAVISRKAPALSRGDGQPGAFRSQPSDQIENLARVVGHVRHPTQQRLAGRLT